MFRGDNMPNGYIALGGGETYHFSIFITLGLSDKWNVCSKSLAARVIIILMLFDGSYDDDDDEGRSRW